MVMSAQKGPDNTKVARARMDLTVRILVSRGFEAVNTVFGGILVLV
jgi:hypothetical protein